MTAVAFVTALVFGFMIAEARVSRAHESWLRAAGAVAPHGDVFTLMAVIYPLAFLFMGAEGAWRAHQAGGLAGGAGAFMRSGGGPSWVASGALLFVASKALKYWAIGSLGKRWSFRVFILPGRPLVRSGPYRYVTHPNYVAVIGELISTAMMVGAPVMGPLGVFAFGAVLAARVRFENRVLAASQRTTPLGRQ